MFVIFPADELVYLSYGRLIYVPLSSTPENPTSTPIRTSSLPQNIRVVNRNQNEELFEIPLEQNETLVEPSVVRSDQAPSVSISIAEPPLKRPSTKSQKSENHDSGQGRSPSTSKRSSSSSKSNTDTVLGGEGGRTGIRSRTVSDSITGDRDSKSFGRLRGGSFKSFLQSSNDEEVTPPQPPVRPERRRSKNSLKIPLTPGVKISRSDLVSGQGINQVNKKFNGETTRLKREKSPIFRFFRGQSASPRTVKSEKTAFDYDSLFNRELSLGELPMSAGTSRLLPGLSSELVRNRVKASSEKTLANIRAAETENQLKQAKYKMAGNESSLRELIHPHYNEYLKSHNGVTFKLVRTVSDFTQQLGQVYEQHSGELQMLVANFRKRNGELRKERAACPSSLFHSWESLLQEIEIDSQAMGDIASILGRQVSRPLLEKSFYRKIQSRKVFTHRESYDTIITKTEEKLAKCRQEYKNAYLSYSSAPSNESLSVYFNTHNAYIQQLHATNGMIDEYAKNTLPSLLQELEEIYSDLCSTVTEAIIQGAELISSRATEQCQRYESLISQCRAVSSHSDMANLARSLPNPTGRSPFMKRIFVPPQPPPPPDGEFKDPQISDNLPPTLKNELVLDRLSAIHIKPSHNALSEESQKLELQIRQIQEGLETLLRVQQRSVEANLFNKANELQEDVSMKRFDLRVAKVHLSAINSQKELFSSKLEGDTDARERRTSSASTGSMKTKWMKAFKSLKTPPPDIDKKNGAAVTKELLKGDPDAHSFQENTYKKITPCDVCSQILRGHTRQGLKCRICKMNIHFDCQDKAAKCQTKARLLRRQKSSSEIETRMSDINADDERVADIYSMTTINRRLSIRNNNNRLRPPIDQFATLERNSQDASGTRPFGQPLCLGPQLENGGDANLPTKSPSPTPSKGKNSAVKKSPKSKNRN